MFNRFCDWIMDLMSKTSPRKTNKKETEKVLALKKFYERAARVEREMKKR